ncbi:hypothetical protein GCM10025868_09100 [Angustibacter aerolatus]|uniref:DegV family EDD domain-containing protein n=1 Tax=Angustibacter aerolatus TaxID=1162965 RepID=A0ABQ6JFQ6_9ACTN|nr:DegV family protein [Angustibacter aerolatus]GMA85660.1 hypothetical protein GCM10025868_09100 [Angustibacter aerolatus]
MLGGVPHDDGVDADQHSVVAAQRSRTQVSTSRPSPQVLLDAYRDAAAAGADAVLSLHISAAMSGTYESAVLAARESPVPVRVVDSRSMGMGLGFLALTSAQEAAAGGALAQARGGRPAARRAHPRVVHRDDPRAPAARRTDRRRVGPARHGAGHQAAAAPRRRDHRAAGAGAHDGSRAGPAGRAWRDRWLRQRVVPMPSTSPCSTSTPLRGPSRLVGLLADRLPGARVRTVEVSGAVAVHVGPGMVALVVAPVR